MNESQTNYSRFHNLLKKSFPLIGIMTISSLISLPVFSQAYYPPLVFFQPMAYPSYPQRSGIGNLMDTLEGDSNYKNFVYELNEAGLKELLKNEEFTILVPNNKAFNDLSDEVFAKFSKPENRIKVLKYHLIPGLVSEEDILQNNVKNLSGNKIVVSNDNEGLKLNNAQAVFPSITATNGVIIEIEKVMLPPDF